MKTLIVRQCRVGMVAGLAFFLGCARPSAEQPTAVNAPPVAPRLMAYNVVAAPPAPVALAEGDPVAPVPTETPIIGERIPPANPPANVALSPGLGEVVKLAQAGVGEEVIFTYVDKFSGAFQLGADQILYLKDLGVSENVIASMLKHDSSAAAAPMVQTQVVSNVPEPLPVDPAASARAASAPPPSAPEVTQFYDALSPYGSWVYLSTYGWCWQPTVAVSAPEWRPYCDSGRWYWSDNGWYWNSDYSWGWAAFHYGRWYHHAGSGWLWAPGLAWGPSWVSWRSQGGYCGWAPLPPEARYVSGVGFSYYGSHVGIGFEFGLSAFHYSFVSVGNFCDYNPRRHFVPRTQVVNVYRNTTVVNNYVVGNNNTIVNHGVGRDTVARNSPTKIREVSVREVPVQNVGGIRGDRIEKQGNQSVVYRPQLPKTDSRITPASYVNRNGAQSVAPAALNRTSAMGRTPSGAGTTVARPTANPNLGSSGQPPQNGRPQNNAGVNAAKSEQKVAPRTQATARSAAPSQPRPSVQPQPTQPRSGNSLFGETTANTAPTPRRNPVNSTPGQRVYTQTPQTQTMIPQTPARTQPNSHSGTMSPRQYEAVPRATMPNYNGQIRSAPQPTAPRQAAPQPVAPPHSAPSGGGGGGGGNDRGNVQSAPRSEARTVPSGGGNGGGNAGGNAGSQRQRAQ